MQTHTKEKVINNGCEIGVGDSDVRVDSPKVMKQRKPRIILKASDLKPLTKARIF